MSTFDTSGFEIIKGFIQPETAKLLAYQLKLECDVDHITRNIWDIDKSLFADSQTDNAYAKGRLITFEALQLMVKDKMETITGKQLLPTYAYARIYYSDSNLPIHVDRPSCEYSVTICVQNDLANWPICIKDYAGNSHSVSQQSGDALVYSGCELEHWRDTFKGSEHIQCFLHYVDANGPYADHIYDGRKALGLR